jgi:hypothetical protein
MRPSISGRLEGIVSEVAAALDVEVQVVPLAAARVAGAALPSEAERPAWAAALSSEVAGPRAALSAPGAAAVLAGRPQLVLAVAQELPAAEKLIAAQVRGFEPGVEAAWPPGWALAPKTEQWPAVRACLPDAWHSVL